MNVIYTCLLGLIPFFASGQSLKEDKIDEFTKHVVKRTSWEVLTQTFKMQTFGRISKIEDQYYFDFKVAMGGPLFSIGKDQELMLKLANETIVTLPNPTLKIACRGCGVPGFAGSAGLGVEIAYPLTIAQLDELRKSPIVKIRVYTTDGYVENEVRGKNAGKIPAAIALVN